MQAKLSVSPCLARLLLQAGTAQAGPPPSKSLLPGSASSRHLPAAFLVPFILTSFEWSLACTVTQ